MTMPVKTMIVDDQVMFREAMRTLLALESDIQVVAEAANGEEGLRLACEHRPQVVLMDLRMPVMGGAEATRRIHRELPGVRVLVLTTFSQEEDVFEALRAGASGYVLKNIPTAQLVDAIKTVAAGQTYLQPSVAGQVVAEFNRLSRSGAMTGEEHRAASLLSQRETEIVRLLTRGRSNKEIASELSLTEGTVKNHMTSILDKLQVPDRTSAALKARDLGLG